MKGVRPDVMAGGRRSDRDHDVPGEGGSGDDGEDVAGGEDQVLLAGVLDLGAAVLAVDDLVTHRDVERDTVAVVVDTTGTDRNDLALLGLLLGRVRDDQAGGGGLLGFERLDDDEVLEGLDVDRHFGSTSTFSTRDLQDVGSRSGGTPSRGSCQARERWHSRGESAR